MIVRTTTRSATLGRWLRLAVLALFALLVAHDAIFLAQFGSGSALSRAMSERGHDGYWLPATLAIGLGAAVIFVVVVGLLARLGREASRLGGTGSASPPYLPELAATWLRLFPTVGLLFAIQENIEHVVVDGHLPGLGVLVGPGSSLVLPVLAATTFVLAALGSLVRWRIRVLEGRIRTARRHTYGRPVASREPAKWVSIAAAIARRWILDRRDAGRAPPRTFGDVAHAAA